METNLRTGLVILGLALMATGCGGSAPPPIAVTGKVLFDGKPMSDGDIYFHPTDGRVPVQSKILDGRYTIKPSPGEYRVAIQQERDSGTKNMYGDPQMTSTVAPRYNSDTGLNATVTADGPNAFDFEVHSR